MCIKYEPSIKRSFGKVMKIKNSKFIISATKREQYPKEAIAEIAFVGRSNVGKSSLINMLLNRKKLAKTSSTPGKTRLINFYSIDEKFRFVDLPGYGYAKVSKSQKEKWDKYISDYLKYREYLLSIFILIDSRMPPTNLDANMIQMIKDLGYEVNVVLTKSDKVKKNHLYKMKQILIRDYRVKNENIIACSSLNRDGKYKFWDHLNHIFDVNDIDIFMERQ